MPRTTTVRLSDQLAHDLEVVARLIDRPATAIVRAAIVELIAEERVRPEFRAAVARLSEENRESLAKLRSDRSH